MQQSHDGTHGAHVLSHYLHLTTRARLRRLTASALRLGGSGAVQAKSRPWRIIGGSDEHPAAAAARQRRGDSSVWSLRSPPSAYNTWRNERTEHNRNIRTAAFEVLTQLPSSSAWCSSRSTTTTPRAAVRARAGRTCSRSATCRPSCRRRCRRGPRSCSRSGRANWEGSAGRGERRHPHRRCDRQAARGLARHAAVTALRRGDLDDEEPRFAVRGEVHPAFRTQYRAAPGCASRRRCRAR